METSTDKAMLQRGDLIALLAPTLGEEKSQELINETAGKLGLPVITFTREQAMDLMEAMASVEGLVGIVARLAKARLRLLRVC